MHLADCTACLRGPYCPICLNGDGHTCVANREREPEHWNQSVGPEAGPKRPPTPEWCERCERNEPRRLCKWCQRHVCTEQCWAADTEGARRCHSCAGRGEDASGYEPGGKPLEAPDETAPPDPWTARAEPGGLRTPEEARAFVLAGMVPATPEHYPVVMRPRPTCTFGGCRERFSELCTGWCKEGICRFHLYICTECGTYPLCMECRSPEGHE